MAAVKKVPPALVDFVPGRRRERERMPHVIENLHVLNPKDKESEDFQNDFAKKPRLRYAAMRGHMERAAIALAAGTSQKGAAQYAGISQRQVKKYWTDPEFRARIEELRSILGSRIKGQIMRELGRRVKGKNIRNMEILDLMRILDRLTIGGKGMSINVAGDVNVSNNYEQVLAALFASNPSGDGEDFPQYGDPSTALPGISSSVEG